MSMTNHKVNLLVACVVSMISAGPAYCQSFYGGGPVPSNSGGFAPPSWAPGGVMIGGSGNGSIGNPVTPIYGLPINPIFGAPNGTAGYLPNPIPIGGGNVNFKIGGANINMWQAPSGYYYPYCFNRYGGFGTGYINTIYIPPNTTEPPVAKQPPLSVQFSDTLKFLEDALKDNKISQSDYDRLLRRTKDIQKKERSYRISQGGILDSDVEAECRRDMDNLTNEITNRIKL